MNIARILILVLAAAAAVVAAIFVRGSLQPSQPVDSNGQPVAQQVQAAPTVRVLAVRRDLDIGHRIQTSDLYWQGWPEDALSPSYLTEARNADAINEFENGLVRAPMSAGEPVTVRKIVQPGDSGFMAAMLSPGMLAVAVPTSPQAGAGGFILPNDRVNVIYTSGGGRGTTATVRTLIENVRVLAIDQITDDEDSGAVVGSTATLEVTPEQAEQLSMAAASGGISLALRSFADVSGGPRVPGNIISADEVSPLPQSNSQQVVRVFRYGREERVALGGNQ